MARTNFIDNLQENINLDTDLNGDSTLSQKSNIMKIVILDGDNGRDEFVKDDVDILYFREAQNEEVTEYTDDKGNNGYKFIFNIGREDFAGEIKSVCLANSNFIDPRFSHTFPNGSSLEGSNAVYSFTADDMMNNATRVLDFDYENGKLLTFNIKYNNGEYSAVFCRWNHNFRNFRIGGAQSYFFLDELVSIDIGDLITIPDGQGNWIAPSDSTAKVMFYYGIDEKNNKYVLAFTEKDNKVFNTLTINKENTTQTELHQMILPNEVSWTTNISWKTFNNANGDYLANALFYKGRFCMPLYTVRTEHEQEINGVYMCSINYKNSTDIVALETHCYSDGVEVNWDSTMPSKSAMPLVYSGCETAIGTAWTIKNNIAYIKKNGSGDLGFYYKGMILVSRIRLGNFRLRWRTCPYCLSIVEKLSKPFLKTLNKTVKYTFKVVNTGGNF